MKKTALIFGVTGQDGCYLSDFLLKKNYQVIGTTRNISKISLEKQSLLNLVDLRVINPINFNSVNNLIKDVRPDEIYNLCGQSSVNLSFSKPLKSVNSILNVTINILESIKNDNRIKVYNAGSSECFGNCTHPADETTPMSPLSPYATAKAASRFLVKNYRDSYGMFCVTGILFNHESKLRESNFVSKKICIAASNISKGLEKYLLIGNIDVTRDWGWAPEYVEAMWLMMQAENPEDFIIATGHTVSLRYFIEKVFSKYNLDWEKYVRFDKSFCRPNDILNSFANPSRAHNILKWKAKTNIDELIDKITI